MTSPLIFSSPDGSTWNGSSEPYQAQLSDVVSIPDDPIYAATDYNGGNVLLWGNNSWALYYSQGVYGPNGKVFQATGISPPALQSAGSVLNTSHYANDVKAFQVGSKSWYVMLLYIRRGAERVPDPVSRIASPTMVSLSEQSSPYLEVWRPEDHFVTTPAFVTKERSILGVLYGANPLDLLNAANQIYARWLQKKSSDQRFFPVLLIVLKGGYGPDRQVVPNFHRRVQFRGTLLCMPKTALRPLGKGTVTISAGQAYQLVVGGG